MFGNPNHMTIKELRKNNTWFPHSCSAHGIVPYLKRIPRKLVGIEVGVLRGENMFCFLSDCHNLKMLYGVDHYEAHTDYNTVWNDEDVKEFEAITMKNLSPFTGRFSLVKKRTQDVVREDFGEDEIDFVLLDADHTYEGMKADLQKFYPMLRMNGYIFVKDYNATAVMNAVKDFRNENKLRMEMNLTNGFTAFWSKQ